MYIYNIYILIVRFHDINPLFKNGLSRSELINWSRSLTRNFSQAAMCPMLRASYQSNQSTNAGWKNDCGVKKGDMTGDKMSWKKIWHIYGYRSYRWQHMLKYHMLWKIRIMSNMGLKSGRVKSHYSHAVSLSTPIFPNLKIAHICTFRTSPTGLFSTF